MGCGLKAPPAAESLAHPVSFNRDLAPVIFEHCAPCHRPGQSGPFTLLNYADCLKHAADLAEVTSRKAMPPWLPAAGFGNFAGERRLTDAQIDLFRAWVRQGTPEGDPQDRPVPPEFASDWQLGKPDLEVVMPEPFVVSAAGSDVYRHFVLPMTLDRPRYVQAVEFRPESRAVHHAFIRMDRSGEARRLDTRDPEPGFPGMDTPVGIISPGGYFLSWQPGKRAARLAAGLGWRVDPGMDLVVQVHLQPRGKPEPVAVRVGLWFTDEPPTQTPVKIGLTSYAIDIPPGARNYTVTDELTLPAEVAVLAVLPHTHYLGRSLEGVARLPDGTEKWLLYIPQWDFNWQGDYQYKEPVALPRGTVIRMKYTFDNSAENPRNPNHPPQHVGFGMSTTNEMAELWLQMLPKDPNDLAALNQMLLERVGRDAVDFNQYRLRQNPRDARAMINLGVAKLMARQADEAWSFFQTAIEVEPGNAEAHYQRGVMLRMRNRDDEAVSSFRTALKFEPRHGRAWGNLGLIALEKNQRGEARVNFTNALEADPSDVMALEQLARLDLASGQRTSAIRRVREALQRDENDPAIRELARELGLPARPDRK